MTALAAWSLLKRFWWAIPLAGVLLYAAIEHRSAAHWKAKQAATQAAFDTTVANYRAASAKAIADNLADVRAKEGDAATITEKANHDLESQLADARRLAADYARRMRAVAAGADQGGPGETRVGEVASPASHPFSAGGVPLLDENDVRVCTDATVKAQGWQTFYASLRERYNTDGTR